MTQHKLVASIQPVKCDNPDHPHGCPFGSRWQSCDVDEAQFWLADITVDGTNVWSVNSADGHTREKAAEALLKRLEDGVTF